MNIQLINQAFFFLSLFSRSKRTPDHRFDVWVLIPYCKTGCSCRLFLVIYTQIFWAICFYSQCHPGFFAFFCFCFELQWNPVNTDTKGTRVNVRIIGVSLLSGFPDKKSQTHVLWMKRPWQANAKKEENSQ